ncbi:uncharacterized protein LOC124124381 [Haliotis rufescens]|uniref:uncharacterized protein LOC124124381 n=1 Tax=Haliotis rufescens TaxID=6454 RepID=UPI00201EAB8B|nr:uncharacterized protein LOC124124381 [Haliotis rufescens]
MLIDSGDETATEQKQLAQGASVIETRQEDVQSSEQMGHQEREISILQFRSEVENWITRMENVLADHLESVSSREFKSSKSFKSSRHSRSSTRSAYTKERARLAELLVEKSFLEESKKLQSLKLDIKIAKSQAPHRQMATAMLSPQPKVPKFKGDPTEYGAFIMSFDARIVPHASSSIDRLYYLEQQLEGEPKDLIAGCLYIDPEEGYTKARDLLSSEAQLHSNRPVDFENLVHFIEFASRSANEPVFGKEAISKSQVHWGSKQGKSSKKDGAKSSSFVTGVDSSNHKQDKYRSVSCYFCRGPHDIESCKQFGQKSLSERRTYLQEKKMCFGCFGFNHMVKGCMKKRSCKKCGKCHPTILHDENFRSASKNVDQKSSEAFDSLVSPDQEKSVSSSCNNIEPVISDTVLQAILPVLIQQKGSDKLVKIYALLDNGSTGCFITEDLRQRLETTSTESSLKLRTMHGLHVVSTHVVEGLVVSDLSGDNAVTLPRTFTREEIPVSHSQIPNPDILKKWPHLCAMADKLPKYLPNLDIGLLIGSNCPLALQPQQVIPSQGEGPFAVLYRHGWTVSGPLYIKFNPVDNTLTCNRVLFQEFTSAKECLTDVILNMFEMDFNPKDTGILPGERGFSREDDQFIDMANKGIAEVNGHFELPLPLRDPDIDFSNNREQAEKRAMWQRKKMLHDDEYHEHYTALYRLLSNGYAYKVPSDELAPVPGKVWYLPHHGVYHPKKPSKIRVVFDCKAKFEGFSLNDRLLQGPDLTNSLIGVLTKFRNEPVAFMADIEAIFFTSSCSSSTT